MTKQNEKTSDTITVQFERTLDGARLVGAKLSREDSIALLLAALEGVRDETPVCALAIRAIALAMHDNEQMDPAHLPPEYAAIRRELIERQARASLQDMKDQVARDSHLDCLRLPRQTPTLRVISGGLGKPN